VVVMRTRITTLLLGLALVGLAACGHDIGDDCDDDTECPAGAYCDSTMPEGMCTKSPCRKGECPEDSVCITFNNDESYCMASCENDDDCRDGYACIDEAAISRYPFCSVEE
jgi:hypothetical protein